MGLFHLFSISMSFEIFGSKKSPGTGFRFLDFITDCPQVEAGHALSLECDYKLEGDILYSLKWYRDDKEFYRYIPRGEDVSRSSKKWG